MPIAVEQLSRGRCYLSITGEVRQVVAFDGERVFYVVEYYGQFRVWNKALWHETWRTVFAEEVKHEVQSR